MLLVLDGVAVEQVGVAVWGVGGVLDERRDLTGESLLCECGRGGSGLGDCPVVVVVGVVLACVGGVLEEGGIMGILGGLPLPFFTPAGLDEDMGSEVSSAVLPCITYIHTYIHTYVQAKLYAQS